MTKHYTWDSLGEGDELVHADEDVESDDKAQEDEAVESDDMAQEDEAGESDDMAQEDEDGESDDMAQEDEAGESDDMAQEDEAGKSDKLTEEDEDGKSDDLAQEDEDEESDDLAQEDEAKTQLKGEENVSRLQYDKGWAWMISVSFFLVNYVYLCFDQAISVLLVDIMDELDTTVSVVSVMFAMNAGFYCLAILLANGILLQHMTNKTMETGAAAINVLATLMFVAQPTVAFFHISSFIKASAKGSSIIASLLFLTTYFREKRNIALAIGLSGSSVCALTVSPLTRYLKDEYGLRGCFLIIAGVELHAVVAALLQRPISSYRKRKHDIPDGSAAVIENSDNHSSEKQTIPMGTYPSPVANLKTEHSVQINAFNEVDQPCQFTESSNLTGNVDSVDDLTSGVLKEEDGNVSVAPTKVEDHTSSLKNGSPETVDPSIHITTNFDSCNNESQKDETFVEQFVESVSSRNSANNFHVIGNELVKRSIYFDERVSHVTFITPELTKTNADPNEMLKDSCGEHVKILVDITERDLSSHEMMERSTLDYQQCCKDEMNPVSEGGSVNQYRRRKNCLQIFMWDKVNLSLLTNFVCVTIFSVYCLGSGALLTSTYLPTLATRAGIRPSMVPTLFVVSGSCEIASRIVSALLSDYDWVPFKKIMGVSALFVGGVCQFMGVSTAYEFFLFYAVVKGLFGGVVTLLSTELIIDTLGQDRLLAVKVMCSLCLCVYVGIQHLIIGTLIRFTGDYVVAFHYVGAMYLLGYVMLLLLPCAEKLQKAREEKQKKKPKVIK